MRFGNAFRTLSVVVGWGSIWATFVAGQEAQPDPVRVSEIEPLAADVESIDGIVAAFYDVISGPSGEPRQWDRDATLYPPNVQFTPTSVSSSGEVLGQLMTKQDFIHRSNDYLVDSGFLEREIHRVTRRFGNVADVASTYEWTTEDGDTGRGINFIHLFHDGLRWWITHATWDSERADNPIPVEFLP
ncbi:MAG: hypothetical protein KAI97_02365 [Gemmatimonadetes bacterium]|nr:hypothetical protein [Gemmatimonadota bacterium]